ncbi:glycoside hydrolase family 99-like domain-containing protein [Mesobacterium pallidum]|uniref:glycoside hydrolase family 99-like domain-containing protein n=1 Tax=Mesobacterium pallidum TaxID=2872037 RepID=UPI001EE32E5B|nr:glycoside hydrolase family 99-like domain-containing protein [Mesobacterium pallidum]
MHDQADTIAQGLVGACDAVTVVYSNSMGEREDGAGDWVGVPQSVYFGGKFRAGLDRVAEDEVMLLVQADAECDDWPRLVEAARGAFERHEGLGLWAPQIHHTPYNDAAVCLRPVPGEKDLWHVAQTDGIVLAIHPQVVSDLKGLDFGSNSYGWGVDWAAIGYALGHERMILRDRGILVRHPKSRGYPDGAALEQMEAFLSQLPQNEARMYRQVRDFVAARESDMAGTLTAQSAAAAAPAEGKASPYPSGPLPDALRGAMLLDGEAFLKLDCAPDLAVLEWANGGSAQLEPVDIAPGRRGGPPIVMPFQPFDNGAADFGEEKNTDWGFPGQTTYHLIVEKRYEESQFEIGRPVEIPAHSEGLHFYCALAVHRARALLRVSLDPMDGSEPEELDTKFDPTFRGRTDKADFQIVRLAVPPSDKPRRLRVSIVYISTNSTNPNEPPTLFVTCPVLAHVGPEGRHLRPTLVTRQGGGDGQWHVARVRNAQGPIKLTLGGTEVQLAPARPDHLDIEVSKRGVVRLKAGRVSQVVLALNGQVIMGPTLSESPLKLPLPRELLFDTANRLELRDASGTLSLLTEVFDRPDEIDLQDEEEIRHPDAKTVAPVFDTLFYLGSFGPGQKPEDPISHYLETGWKEGRDPAPWFSTWHYLADNQDVAASGLNPFVHYVLSGQKEGRKLRTLGRATDNVYAAHAQALAPGEHYEDFDPKIATGRKQRAKVLAYYLPQFHPVPANDQAWGKGFTEWNNIARGMPRFEGHVQPRQPRDLGFYDLRDTDAMRRQVEIAQAAGIHGFCFYHYWFDGERVLERPMNALLADPSIEMPFCLMWANENWTRTWDGHDRDVLLRQTYRKEDDAAFCADLARHFDDPRYIRVGGRPLFFIYRPGQIPEPRETIARWRKLLKDTFGHDPVIFMAQGFDDYDPRRYGLDGAIEFPPHKLAKDLPDIQKSLNMLDPEYAGTVVSYDAVVDRAAKVERPPYPLIRTASPSWDNEARRPGRSMVFAGSTPEKFEDWMRQAIDFSHANPVWNENFVCVNAWNEWAEGAYLEPDVHYGAAYLNAVARAVHNHVPRNSGERMKVVVISHDAHSNGAQILAANMAGVLARNFGVEVACIVGGEGPMLPRFRALGPTYVVQRTDADRIESVMQDLARMGYTHAIANTTVAGAFVPALKKHGFRVTSLIHELPALMASYKLEQPAAAIAQQADHVIFPADVVRHGFDGFVGQPIHGTVEVRPQGLYFDALLDRPRGDHGLRTQLGLPEDCKIVLNVGYADLRKGIDLFVATALSHCAEREDVAYVWVGNPAQEALDWYLPEIRRAGLTDRILITGHVDEVAPYYAAADLFFLTSREDPFPSVVLEAMAMGLPIVGYEGTGGCDALIDAYGFLVPPRPSRHGIEAIDTFLAQPEAERIEAEALRRAAIDREFRFDDYVFGMLERFQPGLARVSVVLPNYKYEQHLGDRLRTIFQQTHPVTEIIVLDDASPDGSVAEITRVAEAEDRVIRLEVNEVNSGSPFPQWRKGVQMARGDYVWIAEADDVASADLVEKLVQQMQDSGAAIGFCDSWAMDQNDQKLSDSYIPYIDEIAPGSFTRSFDMEGPEFLARFLSVKNVILNVSGVVFRRDALLAAMDKLGDALTGYAVAGDWRLYAEICAAGGKVSWLARALNGHRRHATSVTHALDTDKHLSEITEMQGFAAAHGIPVGAEVKAAQAKHLADARAHLGVSEEAEEPAPGE